MLKMANALSIGLKWLVPKRGDEMATWEGFKHGCRKTVRTIGTFRFALPLLMMGVGAMIPTLRVPVGLPSNNGLWVALAVSAGVVIIWLGAEIYTVVDRNTPVFHLQWDDFSSLVMAVALTEWHGRLVTSGQLKWWFIIPWVGVLIDAVLSGWLAINNAAQKPLIQQQK